MKVVLKRDTLPNLLHDLWNIFTKLFADTAVKCKKRFSETVFAFPEGNVKWSNVQIAEKRSLKIALYLWHDWGSSLRRMPKLEIASGLC